MGRWDFAIAAPEQHIFPVFHRRGPGRGAYSQAPVERSEGSGHHDSYAVTGRQMSIPRYLAWLAKSFRGSQMGS